MTSARDGRVPARGVPALTEVGRRSELLVGVVVGILLLAVAAAVTAAPRAVALAADSSLDRAIEEAPLEQRRLAIRAIGDFAGGRDSDPLARHRFLVQEAAEDLPEEVTSRFGDPHLLVDTNRFAVDTLNDEPPASPTFITFRIQPDLDEHSSIVAGRAAAPTSASVDGFELFEFELSTVAADVLGLTIGDRLVLIADTEDPLTRRYIGGLPELFIAELVGLRELAPAQDPYWFGDARMHRPVVADTGFGANFFAFASIPAESLPTRPFIQRGFSPFFVEERRDLDTDKVDVDNVDALMDGLVALEASTSARPADGQPGVVVSLFRVLDAEREQREVARSTLVIAAVGVLGVAVAALAQALQVAFARRRGWLSVARARGASPRQVVVTTAVEVGVISTLAIVAGWLVVHLAMSGDVTGIETWLLVGLWLGAVTTAVVTAAEEARRPIDASGRAAARSQSARCSRAAGWFLVALALGALVTFLRRGADPDRGVDPLAVLVPVLVPLAVVFLSRWFVPAAFGLVGRIRMRFGPGRLIGIRRAIDNSATAVGLIAVLALALTVAGLGLGISRSLDDGIRDASWNEVGAPLRIDSSDPEVLAAVAAIPDVELTGYGDRLLRVNRDGTQFSIRLLTAETAGITALTAGTTADPRWPDGIGTLDEEGRVPVIASSRLGGDRVRRGDEFRGAGSLDHVRFLVIEIRETALERTRDWIVADRAVYEEASERVAPNTTLLLDVPAAARDDVDQVVADAGVELRDRAAIQSAQRDDPLVRMVRWGYLGAGVVAVLLALVSVVGVALITTRQRQRDVSVLALMGADRREVARAVRAELTPPVAAGVLLGTALGWAMARAFDGRFDVSAFAGGTAVSMRADLVGQLLAGAATAVLAGVVLALLVRRLVRVRVDDVLRADAG